MKNIKYKTIKGLCNYLATCEFQALSINNKKYFNKDLYKKEIIALSEILENYITLNKKHLKDNKNFDSFINQFRILIPNVFIGFQIQNNLRYLINNL